jgi:hypothetical protein
MMMKASLNNLDVALAHFKYEEDKFLPPFIFMLIPDDTLYEIVTTCINESQ